MNRTSIAFAAILALCLGATVHAQEVEVMKGEVATIDKAAGKIGIKFTGTVGTSDSIAPTEFKVQNGPMLNAVKPGDKVSFEAERVDGVMTIKTLKKE